ncbi:MAG: imidazole glycerol phosphate synthase subunit HisH [Dechloromonas sp.]|uniref:Imidazole glycerol phosphate synthase subunit HisH n=1 Tax=Candidatus Dechloromonas phosphorivorans TaxID=2899244 RepID=A0A9D7QMJ9_9RHOO|nr:imidazole glycerol phosphate synthase subunit HisH [Candidatus Dechloromonas phosphorivorans]
MSNSKVTVVDYGVGNLYSVQRALEYCGAASVTIGSSPADIETADRLILPGVGAFADGMTGLAERGLINPIRRYAHSGRPMLGICLGMQMLASKSEEFGLHDGLDLIPGRVVPIPHLRPDGTVRKIPAIGWFNLGFRNERNTQSSVFGVLPKEGAMYLVHSYHFKTDSEADLVATYDYDGVSITAAVQRGNIIGLQFHPEKSGALGLGIIASFLADQGRESP